MDLDLIFTGGLLIAAFAIPAFVSAYADRRWPIAAIVMLLAGGGAVYHAVQEDPDRYTLANTDDIIVEVMGRFLN